MDNTKKQNPVVTSFLTLVLVVGCVYAGFYLKGRFNIKVGSVTVGNEYNATSTPTDILRKDALIATGSGVLGSVVITTTGDIAFQLLNATSTTMENRPSETKATSSIILASFPPNVAAGTYTFDVPYTYGLYLDVISGNTGTSTITWRH
jgi:hypothetical protein